MKYWQSLYGSDAASKLEARGYRDASTSTEAAQGAAVLRSSAARLLRAAESETDPAVREMLQGHVDELNTRLNRWETVKRFAILNADLSIESGELTPSMKVKRGLVEREQVALIAGMYA